MPVEECPHGLEPEWCSLCKQQAASILPSGVKRPSAKLAPRPCATRPASGRPAPPPVARSPGEGLASTRKVLFHATALGVWPSIEAHGLRTASQLLDGAPARTRSEPVSVPGPSGAAVTIRDQRPMLRANYAQHLEGVDAAGWLALLNSRVWLFTQQRDLTTLLSRYVPAGGQDVLTFDTARLLRATSGRVEVAAVPVAEPTAWAHCPCRGPDTFTAPERYRGPVADIEEVAIVDGLEDVTGLVTRVVRYHPDRSIEVVFPSS